LEGSYNDGALKFVTFDIRMAGVYRAR